MDWNDIRGHQPEPGVTDALDFVDRYDGEIAYVDSAIDLLLRGYAKRSDLDAALLVFAADHGESMVEHELWFTHGYGVYDSIIRIPLMLRGPGIRRGRFSEVVSNTDIAPTILRHVGVPQPPALHGVALQEPAAVAPERTVYAEGGEGSTPPRAAIRGSNKWVARMRAGSRELHGRAYYALIADPKELAPRHDRILPPELLSIGQLDPDPGGLPLSAQRGSRPAAQGGAARLAGGSREAARARLREVSEPLREVAMRVRRLPNGLLSARLLHGPMTVRSPNSPARSLRAAARRRHRSRRPCASGRARYPAVAEVHT